MADGTSIPLGLTINIQFLVVLSALALTSGIVQGQQDAASSAQRFIAGAMATQASVSERLIENMPNLDRRNSNADIQRLQRKAATLVNATGKNQDTLWTQLQQDLERTILQRSTRNTNKISATTEPTRAPQNAECELLNVGYLPGQTSAPSGCLAGDCPGWTGTFNVTGLGEGVSGSFSDYPVVISTEIRVSISNPTPTVGNVRSSSSIKNSGRLAFGVNANGINKKAHSKAAFYRATIEITGMQLYLEYSDVKVRGLGNLLVFAPDEQTRETTAGSNRPGILHPFLDPEIVGPGEWLSVLFGANGKGTVHFGHLQRFQEPSIIRVCP